ncbi:MULTISPECIES: outer membrane protein assembly factor BamE [unclassified Undibacterium]|uniref:outer membrane protein assembly factor BamE n=1 Tax=unclassified Undibacterium TaxID=2630295 RepID=UPI002AC8FD48|nr:MULTISPECIES: outer membrane protein assembly factor BamE [unclassified Undibacterium]MEB0137921.1 outer membrane protein assembly factor BamE [Undibacterium sp. CCC2.1]MEB0172041.1 outer membrane protein assembly factor BamE [Undibacterium sp. CCC1.1]MEB0174929.1 outer membrane protein assembly factor BamE [Undibacterium sp. CCC3.4]MEB0214863.1 outer membrane protein assembly factor BamE [Undibacterium sp. 5I2]WPX45374.1 outer membrane protein assembly factor BamE [Undibacterium sp. CCC3.4
MRLLFSETIQAQAGRLVGLTLILSMTACASSVPLAAAPATATPVEASAAGTQVTAPTGVKKFLGYISPYRVTVQQGNFVSEEMMSQIKEGMTREQVRFVLGSALLTDMFHEDRWDYIFRLTKPKGEQVLSRVTIYFKNNTVAKFEGGDLPTEKEYLARITESALGIDKVESIVDIDGTPKKKERK